MSVRDWITLAILALVACEIAWQVRRARQRR